MALKLVYTLTELSLKKLAENKKQRMENPFHIFYMFAFLNLVAKNMNERKKRAKCMCMAI